MDGVDAPITRIEACAAETRAWMKTNILIIMLSEGDNIIYSVKQVRNFGIMLDEHMKMDAQISSMGSAGHFHL